VVKSAYGTDRRSIAEGVRATSDPNPNAPYRTSYELVRDAHNYQDMRQTYAERIEGASDKLLERYGSDTRLGPAIRRVAETLATFLPTEKRTLEAVAWGEVPVGMTAMLSRHTNLLGGIFKGGIRMASDVDVTTLETLSSDMTRKLALLGVPMNGGKACIVADSRGIQGELRKQNFTGFTEQFFPYMGPLAYVPAGDIGTDTPDMEVIRDAYAANLQRLAGGILTGEETSIGPYTYGPQQGRDYFKTNVLGDAPAEDFLRRTAMDDQYAKFVANPVVTAKPEDSGGNAVRRGATSRGARVALEEAVITKALKDEWKSSVAPDQLDEQVATFFLADGALSGEGKEFLTAFKEGRLGVDENHKVREVVHALCRGKTAVIQGYGKVGRPLHAELDRLGIRVIAAADVDGIVHNEGGLSPSELGAHALTSGSVAGFGGDSQQYAEKPTSEVLEIKCDILVPAAKGGVINFRNAGKINAGIVLEAANDPTTAEADEKLDERGILRVPDIVANTGGVWASYFEWALGLPPEMPRYQEFTEPVMRIHRRLHQAQDGKKLQELTHEELIEVHEQGMRDVYRSVEVMVGDFNVPFRQASCMRTILNLAEKVAGQNQD
ncbi:MAG: Glu/Leu/Phe/Val dehydrogenase dimerization domain-containing protein, partial [Candidatus Altiarchaeota archaeon]